MLNTNHNLLTDFDLFVDEDVRSRRIGVLLLEKNLTPALAQALFRVREDSQSFIHDDLRKKYRDEKEFRTQLSDRMKQIREVKWSGLNVMRSFIAKGFLENFFHYWAKGPLPIMFFNLPFLEGHFESINNFFKYLEETSVESLKDMQNSNSVLFLDSFNTSAGLKIEHKIRSTNNLSRCYRIDSRSHDLIQLCDLLLGISTHQLMDKTTENKSKLRVLESFDYLSKKYTKKHPGTYQSIYVEK